ncbi:hypothetical protein MWU75_07575 [Ornithinimicrobium sp. F0845]|uniref:hypothetical protein n=1 Tax=Ornithinimicrobium sp. F0845 TaxID=2926412 RepID=UPI001FF572E2|nr:hypothetical protein [Ornithinimicrobium sp. F0845]MCK0111993.1 hypothetical protein [Ornithinimicrobium sp. F0845]
MTTSPPTNTLDEATSPGVKDEPAEQDDDATAQATDEGNTTAGPHTMRSLVAGFVPDSRLWNPQSGDAGSIVAIDLSRVLPLVDVSRQSRLSHNERMDASFALGFTDVRFAGCAPHLTHDDMGWAMEVTDFGEMSSGVIPPLDATGVVSHHCFKSGFSSNLLLRGPLAEVPFPDGVAPHDVGLHTVVEADDFESTQIDPDLPRLSPVGAPVRIARSATDVFLSGSTPEARAWLNQDLDASMAADEAVMAIIDQLDEHEAFVATVAIAIDPLADLRDSRDRAARRPDRPPHRTGPHRAAL